MYTAFKNSYYFDNSVCKDFHRECNTKIKSKKKSEKKRNELEIKLISILLIFGNILALREVKPSLNSLTGNFLKYTVIFSLGIMATTYIFKKLKAALQVHK